MNNFEKLLEAMTTKSVFDNVSKAVDLINDMRKKPTYTFVKTGADTFKLDFAWGGGIGFEVDTKNNKIYFDTQNPGKGMTNDMMVRMFKTMNKYWKNPKELATQLNKPLKP